MCHAESAAGATFFRSCSAASSSFRFPVRNGTTCASLSVNRSLTDSSPFQLSRCVLRSTKHSDGSPSPYHLQHESHPGLLCNTGTDIFLLIVYADINMVLYFY